MTDPRLCEKCLYRTWNQTLGHHCEYALVTGHTRLAMMTPEQRKAGYCPVYAAGETDVLKHRAMLHMYDNIRREEVPRVMYDRAPFYKAYRAGKNDKEIAEAVGCSESVVGRWRRSIGLPSNGKRGRGEWR